MEILEPHVGLGMLGPKFLQIAAHVVEPHRIDGGNPHPTGHFVMKGANLVFESIVGSQDLAAAVEERFPLTGGHQRSLGSLDQLHAEPALQLADDLAGPRLGNAVVLGRPGKAPSADDVAEDIEGLQVHGNQKNGQKPHQMASSVIKKPNDTALHHS